jgi:hypothetical protein
MPMLATEGFSSALLIIVFVGFCAVMVYTPAVSLSLEGKNFWIVKSMPLKAETVMSAKIGFNLLISLPITLVASTIFGIAFAMPWYEVIALWFGASRSSIIVKPRRRHQSVAAQVDVYERNGSRQAKLGPLVAVFRRFCFSRHQWFWLLFLGYGLDPLLAISVLMLFNGAIGLAFYG